MKYQLKGVEIKSYSIHGSSAVDDHFDFVDQPTEETGSASNHDKWIDVLSTDWGMNKPTGSEGYTATDDHWVRDARDDTASDPLPAEEITLGYTEIEWAY